MKRVLLISSIPAPLLAISLFPPITVPTISLNPPSLTAEVNDKEKNVTQPSVITPQMRLIAKEYMSLAYICIREEKLEKAIGYFLEVIKRTPDNIEALGKLGEISEQLHRYSCAIEYYKKIIDVEPTNALAHAHLGMNYFHTQQLTEAKNHLKTATEANPKIGNAQWFLGMIAQKEKQYPQAISYYKAALAINPQCLDIHYHLGTTYSQLSQWVDAIAHFEKALEIDSAHSGTLMAYANTCNLNRQPEKAVVLYEKVLAKEPYNTTARYNYGYTLKQQSKLTEAIAVYRQVIEEQPDYALAHFSLALTYLALGNFEQGFLEYEWRSRLYREPLPEVKVPRWQGEALYRKSILLVAEQGLSDTIQFIRYAQKLKKDGAHITIMSQEPLIPLLKLCNYLDHVISIKDPVPLTDYWIPLISLPLQFKTSVSTIPTPIPYFKAAAPINAYWKSYLSEDTNVKVGICWHGNDAYNAQTLKYTIQLKSIPLKNLVTLSTVPGITLYSLQQQHGVEQIQELADQTIVHTFDKSFDVAHGRFMDSAGVINNLDLVISADTAIAHLAAALGKNVWLLVSTPCDWRWSLQTADNSWYPNIRIFRQKNPGDWDSVITEVTKELETFVKKTTLSITN